MTLTSSSNHFLLGRVSARMEGQAMSTARKKSKGIQNVSVWVLVLSNLLVFQFARYGPAMTVVNDRSESNNNLALAPDNPQYQWNPLDPLQIPQGSPPNMPSIRDNTVDDKRSIYGGAGDKKHLGGFTEIDTMGISPTVFKYMMSSFNIHSFLDVGCGRGISTRWFLEHGADVLCVEGSHDALSQSFLPSNLTVEHDYSRGPWWPEKTYDAAWAVEFLEHVSRNYHFNYIQTLRKAALIFTTSSRWGGWHHVEVHHDAWWIQKFESYGFRYSQELTDLVRKLARDESYNSTVGVAPNGKPYFAQHIYMSMKVYINPSVAALPEHNHLFFEHGCFKDFQGGVITNRPCTNEGIESELPQSYLPLQLTEAQDQAWFNAIQAGINVTEA